MKPLFYRTGRILPIPCHYEYIGLVKQVWKKAFSVQIESGTLKVGDRISIEFPVDFYEQPVASLQLNDVTVQAAAAGQEFGILRHEASLDMREGFPVYQEWQKQLPAPQAPNLSAHSSNPRATSCAKTRG